MGSNASVKMGYSTHKVWGLNKNIEPLKNIHVEFQPPLSYSGSRGISDE